MVLFRLHYLALFGAMIIIGLSAGNPARAMHKTGGDLLPDIVTPQPRDLSIEVVNGGKRLRFTNEVANQHTGVLEVAPASEGVDCAEGGAPGQSRLAYQRIYRDADGDGVFTRGVDTEFWTREVGCMVLHPAHDHWHMEDFSAYELWDSSGAIVFGTKTTTCSMDSYRGFRLPGSPTSVYYSREDCNQTTPQGVSIGWVDRYASDLPDQYIDITEIADGDYCLVSTFDPNNQFLEVDTTNNSASLWLRLEGDTVTTFPNEPCPYDNPGPSPASLYDESLRWRDWSWNTTIDPLATTQVRAGSHSLMVAYDQPWAGLLLRHPGFDTSPYTHLQFALHADGNPFPALDIALHEAGETVAPKVPAAPYAVPDAGGWYFVTIPLEDLDAVNQTIVEVEVQEGMNTVPPPFYLDNFRFVADPGAPSPGDGDAPTPTPPASPSPTQATPGEGGVPTSTPAVLPTPTATAPDGEQDCPPSSPTPTEEQGTPDGPCPDAEDGAAGDGGEGPGPDGDVVTVEDWPGEILATLSSLPPYLLAVPGVIIFLAAIGFIRLWRRG
ncbi:MAG: hypothetical protein HY532_00260 [Chloroflexi bacterium]|nr:hypothetical protein [Chloroflexota bacterium]